MAAAHVSGVCAVVWAHYPDESYRQIISRVLSSADPLSSLAGGCITSGRVNLQQALTASLRPILSVSRSGNQFDFIVQGEPDTMYEVDVSSDFQSWSPLMTNRTGTDGKFTVSETISDPQRFFRARSP